jgi:CPA2 family monovalent cation:H+ antiporter-2
MIETARTLNPSIEIVIRTHSEEVAAALRARQAGAVFMGEHELAQAMSSHVLQRMGMR